MARVDFRKVATAIDGGWELAVKRFVDCRLTFGDDAYYRVERERIESIVPIGPEHFCISRIQWRDFRIQFVEGGPALWPHEPRWIVEIAEPLPDVNGFYDALIARIGTGNRALSWLKNQLAKRHLRPNPIHVPRSVYRALVETLAAEKIEHRRAERPDRRPMVGMVMGGGDQLIVAADFAIELTP